MTDSHAPAPNPRFIVRLTSDSHFAWVRTRLALERTLMAWVRTAIALIGFGFTIEQVFDRLRGLPGVSPVRFPEAPHFLGLSLIFCGVSALVISVLDYHWALRYLSEGEFAPIAGVAKRRKWTPLYYVCIALILVGGITFFAVLFHFA